MITKRFILFIVSVFCLSLTSCSFGMYKVFDHGKSIEERVGDISEIAASAVSSGTYSFVVITDVHFGSSKGRHDDSFIAELGKISPAPSFCVCLGDIADHGRDSEYDDFNALAGRVNAITGGKVYTVVGNHDLYNDGWEGFQSKIYPNTSYYKFKINNISYYFLDSGSGSLGKKQFNNLKKDMMQDSNRKIVCNHYPVYGTADFFASYYSLQNTLEADQLLTLLKQRGALAYLSGHMHSEHSTSFGSFTEYVVPGYLDNRKFAVVTVDKTNMTASYNLYSF